MEHVMPDTYDHHDSAPLTTTPYPYPLPEAGLPQQMLDELSHMLSRQLAVYACACQSCIADQIGLPLIDFKALEFVMEFGALPTGQLTRLLGLSSGGTTALINRLEEAGYVERDRHPLDRRIIVIKPNQARCEQIPFVTEQVLSRIVATAARQNPSQLAGTHGLLHHCMKALRNSALQWLDTDSDVT